MRRIICAAAVAALFFLGWPAELHAQGNAYKDAKVGDWTQYKISTKSTNKRGSDISKDSQSVYIKKETVIARNKEFVTIRVETEAEGKAGKSTEMKIPLKPDKNINSNLAKRSKVEKLGSGEEVLNIGGKKYPCKWFKQKTVAKITIGSNVVESKSWISDLVPLTHIVKAVSTTKIEMPQFKLTTRTTMELIAFGRGR